MDKKRERRERLRQWQEKMNKKEFVGQKNQLGNKGRSKKKLAAPAKGDKRRSSSQSLKSNESHREGDRDSHRRPLPLSKAENDDYFEIPMDVESDSTGDDSRIFNSFTPMIWMLILLTDCHTFLFKVSSQNLVLYQTINITKLMVFVILIACLVNNVLIM